MCCPNSNFFSICYVRKPHYQDNLQEKRDSINLISCFFSAKRPYHEWRFKQTFIPPVPTIMIFDSRQYLQIKHRHGEKWLNFCYRIVGERIFLYFPSLWLQESWSCAIFGHIYHIFYLMTKSVSFMYTCLSKFINSTK